MTERLANGCSGTNLPLRRIDVVYDPCLQERGTENLIIMALGSQNGPRLGHSFWMPKVYA